MAFIRCGAGGVNIDLDPGHYTGTTGTSAGDFVSGTFPFQTTSSLAHNFMANVKGYSSISSSDHAIPATIVGIKSNGEFERVHGGQITTAVDISGYDYIIVTDWSSGGTTPNYTLV